MSYQTSPATPATSTKTEAEAVAAIALAGIEPITHGLDTLNVPVIVLPKTGEVKSLEFLQANPRRARASVVVRDQASFVEYVRTHKGPGTVIFAEVTESGGSFTAILDFHVPRVVGRPAPDGQESEADQWALAQWGEHSCKYVCEFSPEWKRWAAQSGKNLPQAAMALFIEDNLWDIWAPPPTQMLELVKSLEATQGVSFKSTVRLDNGDRHLHYAYETTAKAGQQGELEVPQIFRLSIPLFVNGPSYEVECRFRYDIGGGVLAMRFEIVKPHKLIEEALKGAQMAIAKALNLPVLLGAGGVI